MAQTTNFGFEKPDATRKINEEFPVLGSTLDTIDAALKAILDNVNSRAPAVHSQAISTIVGLTDALASKMPANAIISLDTLSDVSGAAAAANGYVLVKSATGWVPSSAAAAIGVHQHQIGDIVGLDEALTDRPDRDEVGVTLGEGLSTLSTDLTAAITDLTAVVDERTDIASQAVAEAGEDNTKKMTPLRVWQAAAKYEELHPRGLKLLAEAPASAMSQYDFTALPAGLKHVVVVLNGVVKGTTAASMQMLIGTGGTFATSGYIAKAVNSIDGAASQGQSSASAFPLQVASGTQTLTGAVDLYRVNGDDWVLSGELATESGIATIGVAGRLTNLGGDLERIRIALTASSFNAGTTISIFGE